MVRAIIVQGMVRPTPLRDTHQPLLFPPPTTLAMARIPCRPGTITHPPIQLAYIPTTAS